jgi:SET domain-containing protein
MKTKKKRKGKYTIQKQNLRVGRSGTGKGLFTNSEISRGVCITEYVGINVKEADQYKVKSKYLFWVAKDKMINGNIPKNIARYINHSCRPNCEADGPKGKVYILSTRKIKSREELTYNYGKEYFNEYIKPNGCRCVKCKV